MTSVNPIQNRWETPAVNTLEIVMHEDRGDTSRKQRLHRIFRYTRGQLAAAARSIVTNNNGNPNIRIMTGFYIEKTGSAETDGVLSAAQMAFFFKLVGVECCIVTDKHCQNVCEAALDVYGCKDLLEIVDDNNSDDTAVNWDKRGVTHVIAIKRPGPGFVDCIPYNMKGEPITHCVQMHDLFKGKSLPNGCPWTTIGIIDRGNEIGSGSLPGDIVSDDIDNGSKIWCKTGADHLLVSRVSNWAANALTVAVALHSNLNWVQFSAAALDVKLMEKALKSIVSAGAVDGITYNNDSRFPTVDALPLSHHIEKTELFLTTASAALMGRLVMERKGPTPHRHVDGRTKSKARGGERRAHGSLKVIGLGAC